MPVARTMLRAEDRGGVGIPVEDDLQDADYGTVRKSIAIKTVITTAGSPVQNEDTLTRLTSAPPSPTDTVATGNDHVPRGPGASFQGAFEHELDIALLSKASSFAIQPGGMNSLVALFMAIIVGIFVVVQVVSEVVPTYTWLTELARGAAGKLTILHLAVDASMAFFAFVLHALIFAVQWAVAKLPDIVLIGLAFELLIWRHLLG
ncbi:hypothetical protein AURDEDRAFT_159465 [Auricularia subglabra TFB-10046 SS5]|nr:hypothetical protein AURDEDRAFT_159465 [Auricularia subglabra TFB-10046 SS5]